MKRSAYLFILKIIVAILTVMTTVSVISYIFSWKADQSLLGAKGGEVANAASSGGFSLGHFLVSESFGLAALVLVAFLCAWSVSLFWKACPWPIKKLFWGCFSGTFILSWILAFGSLLFGSGTLFGAGAGGRFSAALMSWMIGGIGPWVTAAILI